MVNLDGPALAPPTGVTPNLVNPPNDNDLVGGVAIFCLVVVTIMVLMRCYTRYEMKRFLIEDFLMLIGYAIFITWVYLVFRIIRGTGFYVHQWDVRLKDTTEFSYVIFVGANIYGICIACVKAALLIEWIRILVPGQKTRNVFYWCATALIVLNSLYYTAATVSQNLACTPHSYNYDKLLPGGGHCVDTKRLNLASACINLVSDVAILVLPQQIIWRLQMSTKRRLGLSIIFAAGLFGCATAIARVVVTLDYTRSEDVTYTVSPVTLWATGEMTSVFFVFCITSLPKIIKDKGVLSRLAASFRRSWTRIPRGGSYHRDGRSSGQETPPAAKDSWDQHVGADSMRYYHAGAQFPLGEVPNESTKQLHHAYQYSQQV